MGQMYKVFFNERVVCINAQKNESLFNNALKNGFFESQIQSAIMGDLNSSSPRYLIDSLADFERFWALFIGDDRLKEVWLEGRTEGQVWNILTSFFHVVEAAGGLVFNSDKQMLFIERLGRWDLPKGKIDRGESAEDAAIREVEEETGVLVSPYVKKADTTFHVYASPYHNGEWVLKPTYWFEMQAIDWSHMQPQHSERISDVSWLSTQELKPVVDNTYASLKDTVNRFSEL